MAIDLTWPTIIGTALVDSINPCAIGVLILLITTLLTLSRQKRKNMMLFTGLIYISAVYVTYFFAGIGLLLFIQKFNLAEPLSVIVGGVVILLGLIEIKDFFWYGKGITLSIPPRRAEQIKQMMKKISIPSSIILGVFVAAVELPCTGGPYLAITTLLATKGLEFQTIVYLLVYNFIFVLPLIVILLLVYFGASAKKIKAWKDKAKKWIRLFIGIVMICLGILLILIGKNIIRFGF